MSYIIYQEGIENSMRRSSIPTSIPLFEIDCDCDEISVVTTETFGAEIVAATKQEFHARLKALTIARASDGKCVSKDECEVLLYKIHAEQREQFFGSTSVDDDKCEDGDISVAEIADVEVVAGDAAESKELMAWRRPRAQNSSLSESMSPPQTKPRMETSSLRPKGLSDSTSTVKRSNKSRKKEVHFDDRINWDGTMSQSGFTAKDLEDEEGGYSDNDSRREELLQLIELKLQLANQQALIDSLNAKLSSMSRVQERNNDLEMENDVLWKKVMTFQSTRNHRSIFVTQSNDSVKGSASMNQCRSVVDKILRQSCGSTGTEETAPCSAASDIQLLYRQ